MLEFKWSITAKTLLACVFYLPKFVNTTRTRRVNVFPVLYLSHFLPTLLLFLAGFIKSTLPILWISVNTVNMHNLTWMDTMKLVEFLPNTKKMPTCVTNARRFSRRVEQERKRWAERLHGEKRGISSSTEMKVKFKENKNIVLLLLFFLLCHYTRESKAIVWHILV